MCFITLTALPVFCVTLLLGHLTQRNKATVNAISDICAFPTVISPISAGKRGSSFYYVYSSSKSAFL